MQQYYMLMPVGLCTIVFKCTLQHLADHDDEVQSVCPFEFAMMALSTASVAHVIMSSLHNLTVHVDDIIKTSRLLVWSVC